MRADHAAILDTLYAAGAIADPILTDTDGVLTVSWPRGRGTLAACLMSAELLEQWVNDMNALRAEVTQLRQAR